ncbi:23S rRNA (pseudouridine(1915)-N(3))-methyltransferase RlmH [Thiomicrorhabdus lithotrophica]|uniref:Ribosomal RNA large subunit methyltransferase H n=1 Tax=Thiomicrorhabdus lithotrophica TaxID=2949997 RepID=A0ABY8C8F5_9GAMM|nr:23S rRNA (pseudouridine(1915)-N(3))-methyltransferase RlmH [Thiomicrorhabdus lithotrophica]WEJ62243.1 23S rRNA (pseudouridine(1915)-N(3))-methyltransferase RlmH [Thiomicrorhabdus lithotrophica]
MVIHFITVGQKMPKWVQDGYAEYAKRLPKSCAIKLVELPMAQRGKTGSADKYKAEEAKKILAAIPKGAQLIVLDEHGEQVTTKGLAVKLEDWLASGQDVALIVGGPDGLEQSLIQQAKWKWGLSKLTMPHPMVRILVAEQIYRAYSVINNHPYHRE